jgi:hypothetical protein
MRSSASSPARQGMYQPIPTAPPRTESAPCLTAPIANSCSTIASVCTAAVSSIRGGPPRDTRRLSPFGMVAEGTRRANGRAQVHSRPAPLRQQCIKALGSFLGVNRSTASRPQARSLHGGRSHAPVGADAAAVRTRAWPSVAGAMQRS